MSLSAQRRLMRDLEDIEKNPLTAVAAKPLHHNIFEW